MNKLLAVILLCVPFNTFSMTGGDLKKVCDVYAAGNKDTGEYVLCVGYVRGVVEGAKVRTAELVANKRLSEGERDFCYPPGVTYSQIALVVAKYFKDHPEDLHWPAAMVVFRAIHNAWPCD